MIIIIIIIIIKRNRTNRNGAVQFSSEPGNLLNVNTFKYSGTTTTINNISNTNTKINNNYIGIANTRTIDIAQVNDTVVMKKKVSKNLQKPSKSIETKVLVIIIIVLHILLMIIS